VPEQHLPFGDSLRAGGPDEVLVCVSMMLARSTRPYRPMYRIDSVIHGMTSPLNHSAGFWVSGVYPSGGTQLNKNVSCSPLRDQVGDLPTQNTGAETPISASTISSGSNTVP
jgi:hypothetical protein